MLPQLSLPLMTALVLSSGLAACGSDDSRATQPKASRESSIPVLAGVAERKTVPFRLRAVGNVETMASVAVKSRVDGQIVKVYLTDGAEVTQGQLLFQIDPRPFHAQLKQAEANLLKDQAQLDYTRGQEERQRDLVGKGFVSEEAYAQARANLEAAQAAVAADQAAIEAARLQLRYATIHSPISGRAGKVLVSEGNLVKANDASALVVINQITPIYASFAVAEQYGPQIRAALLKRQPKVEVSPSGSAEKVETGDLAFVDNAVDVSTGTLRLRARFANRSHTLWPGEFVEVVLTLGEDRDALVVPSQAILNGPNGPYAFVIKPDLTVEQRSLRLGRTEGQETIVVDGLAPGEKVVTDGASRLTPGAPVTVQAAGAPG